MEVKRNDSDPLNSAFHKQMQQHADMEQEALSMWDKHFEKKVRRQNFFAWGFFHFNIYLLSAGIMVLLAGGLWFFTSSSSTSSIPTYTNTKKKNVEPVVYDSTFPPTPSKTYNVSPAKKKIHTSDAPASTPKESLTEPEVPVMETVPTPVAPAPAAPVVIREKRTVYVEKRDTVEIVDTIRSKKEWKKWNKNNK